MNLIQSIQKFIRDEEGISTVEYGLVLALVGVVVAAGLTTLGTNINAEIAGLATRIVTLIP